MDSSLSFSLFIYLLIMLALSLFLYMRTVNNTHTSKWTHTYVGTHHEIEHFECEHIKWTLLLFFLLLFYNVFMGDVMITFLLAIFQAEVKSSLCMSQLSMKRDLTVSKGDVCTPLAYTLINDASGKTSIDFSELWIRSLQKNDNCGLQIFLIIGWSL